MENKKILIIQTAFIGDVILATSLVEYIKNQHPTNHVDFLLRDGNQSILETNPFIKKLWIWNKSKGKYRSLISLVFGIRKEKYDYAINIQRFFNSGLLTCLSGAKKKIGFKKNPLSIFFTHRIEHRIPDAREDIFLHEVQRNLNLLFPLINENMPSAQQLKTKLYFNDKDKKVISTLSLADDYIVLAPSSVWYTKQWPIEKWDALIKLCHSKFQIILIGAPDDREYLKPLENNQNTLNLAGNLSLRQSALLMKNAKRVFVNDSAPLHLASSVNAKTTAIFCSTVPDFGYFPLSDDHEVIQLTPRLSCMPCGLHGHSSCPKGHFKCALNIDEKNVFNTIRQI